MFFFLRKTNKLDIATGIFENYKKLVLAKQ